MRALLAALAFACLLPAPVLALPLGRPVLLELFTSQGCSSCPPADAIVAELAATRPDLLPLTFHVTYWDSLGWHDPYSFEGATQRQRQYVARSISPNVYTPALVVDGRQDVVGSDADAVREAVARATQAAVSAAVVDVAAAGNDLSITIGAGTGNGFVLLVGYDRSHRTAIGRGENGGRTLLEANVVRSLQPCGTWTGHALQISVKRPEGEEMAAILQGADGAILGAGRLSMPARP